MKNKLKKILIVVVILLVLGIVGIIYINNRFYDMNEKITIKEENIDITIKSIDTYTIENEYEDIGLPSLIAGDYYKVEIEVTNNGTTEYTRLASNFILVDKEGEKTVASLILLDDDVEDLLPETIGSNQTVSGYLYFERELADNKYLGEAKYLNYESLAIPGKLIVYPVKLH